LLILEFSAK